jgi:uncharacterized protein (DUF1778 family)
MQLEMYAGDVQEQLVAAAQIGDDRVRDFAGKLAAAAAPAIQLVLLKAITAVAHEVTAALLDSPGAPAVSVRLDADDVEITVTTTAVEPASALRPDDVDTAARITLRLSEALKADVDRAAGRAGVSVNTWLVGAAISALEPTPGAALIAGRRERSAGHGHSITGWING